MRMWARLPVLSLAVLALAAATLLGLPAVGWAAPDAAQLGPGSSAREAPLFKTVEIVTVPPMPAARFALNGIPLSTDAHGVARATVTRSKGAKDRLELLTPHLEIPDATADFVRWVGHGLRDQGYTPVLTDLSLRNTKKIQVAFHTTRLVSYSFMDQASHPIEPSRITSLTIRSDFGQTYTLHGVEPVRLTGIRPVLEGKSAVAKEAKYYLQSVVIDGTNVVNAGEQRFVPSRASNATFVVLLRSVHFHVSDHLFGNSIASGSIASGVELTYPDGNIRHLAVGADGDVTVENLARGTYQVKVLGPGYSGVQEIALSRSQYVNLPVLTYLDLVVAAGVALLALVVLVLLGRMRVRRAGEEPT